MAAAPAPSLTGENPLPSMLDMAAKDWPAPTLWGLIQNAFSKWPAPRQVALRTLLTYEPLLEKTRSLALGYERHLGRAAAIEGVAQWLAGEQQRLATRWAEHPQSSVGDYSEKPWKAEVLAVFTHRPGRDGRRMSLYQSSFEEVLSPGAWAWQKSRVVGDEQNEGQFAGLAAIPRDWTIDTRRQGYLNNSAATEGSRGYFARERLKSLFPTRSRGWIGKIRKWNRRAKGELLQEVLGEPWMLARTDGGGVKQTEMVHKKTQERAPTPDWYQGQTKAEAWMSEVLPEPVRSAADAIFHDASALWDAASGNVHPADLDELLLPARERRSRKRRLREDRRAWQRIDQERGGQRRLDF